MKRSARVLALTGVLALFALAGRAEPPMWTITTPHGAMVIFGSMHLLPRGLQWRSARLADALAQADELWFEIPIGDASDATASRLVVRRGALPAKDSLFAHLTPAVDERLVSTARSLGVAPATLAPMRPWLAELTLSIADDLRAGALASEGVDEQIQNTAPGKARRRAFETASQQIALLAGASFPDQAASLDETLKEIDERDAYDKVVMAWMAGDLPALEAAALEPLRRASPTTYRRLITDRNQRWTKIIKRRLNRGGKSVVIVGVGHLIGPGGVPALLRAEGVDVNGP